MCVEQAGKRVEANAGLNIYGICMCVPGGGGGGGGGGGEVWVNKVGKADLKNIN